MYLLIFIIHQINISKKNMKYGLHMLKTRKSEVHWVECLMGESLLPATTTTKHYQIIL